MSLAVLEGHTALLNQALQYSRRWIDWEYTLDLKAPSTTPIWDACGRMSDIEVCQGRGNTKKLAKKDAERWLVTELKTNIELPCTTSDLAKELIAFHTKRMVLVEFDGEKIDSLTSSNQDGGTGAHNDAGVRIYMDDAKGYMNSDDQGSRTPIKPSDKALEEGRALVEEPDGFSELEKLMLEKLPLNLTGDVVVADYREPKHGGFAFVYKGVWKGKEVAVKRLKYRKNLRKPAPWEASMERRLTREINVWAALSHRNIAEFLGFVEDSSDFPAMISTWYNLGTARDFLDTNEDMAMEVRIRIVQHVADVIEYLHSLKIIHGDLKPTNILIDDNHVARLCDFGLVRLDDWQGPPGMTTTSPYTGTERYKAPELFISATNRHPCATCEGDIYALGCIALEIIESTIPFERCKDSYGLAKAVADGEPPASPPKGLELGSIFSQYIWYILEACWAWYPENRFKVNQIVVELIYLSELQSTLLETQ